MAATHRTFNHPFASLKGRPDLTGLFYCDTSYLAGVYLPSSRTYQLFHSECVERAVALPRLDAFQRRLFNELDVLCVTSDWALNEVAYLVQQEQLASDCQQFNVLHGMFLTPEAFRRQNPAVLAHSWDEIVRIRADIEDDCEIVAIPNTGLT